MGMLTEPIGPTAVLLFSLLICKVLSWHILMLAGHLYILMVITGIAVNKIRINGKLAK